MFKHTVFYVRPLYAEARCVDPQPCVWAVAQQRQSFSALPPLLLSSVIKGRGKSRGEGWALIVFHGREERAAACPEGLRRC